MYSDRELTQEIDAIVETTSTSKAEWDDRVEALRRFQGLLHGNAAEFDSFPSLVRRMVDPLCKQVRCALSLSLLCECA